MTSTHLLAHLLAQVRADLMRHAPFARMEVAHVDLLVSAAEQMCFASGERVLAPEDGIVHHLYCIRSGAITGQNGLAEETDGFEYEAGDLFPVGAVMGVRPVTAIYHAHADTFCLRIPAEVVQQVAALSAPFSDFLSHRVLKLLDYSRQALQVAYSSQTLAEQSLERPLRELVRPAPVGVSRETSIAQALAQMHERRIGSILVLDPSGAAAGIVTRHDVLGRVALAQAPLDAPIERVMTTPVHCLGSGATAQDAALLMARHGIRHVPVTEAGRVIGIVSERDLFAMQRLSLKQVSTAIRTAGSVDTLRLVARDIRRFACNLLGQGVGAHQLTELVSHLNDVFTERLVGLIAEDVGVDLRHACWLAFGSEGRSEQTIATDQDNGLVFASDDPQRDRARWLAFGRRVNEALDACGYPPCRGNVMAGNPECCLTPGEWSRRFNEWMEHGAPKDLLAASIYFDFRPLVGNAALAEPMRELITRHAARLPRFIKQMAENAVSHSAPLNWHGGLDARHIDLKLQGTVIFVDAARVYALAHGITHTNTRRRFEAVAEALGMPAHEAEAWVGGFEYLQMLRLRVQVDGHNARTKPNTLDVDTLNDIDRRVLKEALRVARRLQQRMELDYQR